MTSAIACAHTKALVSDFACLQRIHAITIRVKLTSWTISIPYLFELDANWFLSFFVVLWNYMCALKNTCAHKIRLMRKRIRLYISPVWHSVSVCASGTLMRRKNIKWREDLLSSILWWRKKRLFKCPCGKQLIYISCLLYTVYI